MKPIRAPLLQGSQPIRALLLQPKHKAWILAHWQPGYALSRVEHALVSGFLLEFPSSQQCDVASLPGLALITKSSIWKTPGKQTMSALYSADPRQAAPDSDAKVMLVLGNQWLGLAASEFITIDASDWIELADYVQLKHAAAPTEPALTIPQLPDANADVRTIFGKQLPATDPGSAQFLQARESAGTATARKGSVRLIAGEIASAGINVLTKWLSKFQPGAASKRARYTPGTADIGDSSQGKNQAPAGISWLRRCAALLGIGRLLGMQHAAFLAKMLRDLDEGNIDEALRRAIPINQLNEAAPTLAPNLEFLTMRQRLSWTHSAKTSVGLAPGLFDHLSQRYRTLFRQLDRQNRFEEAAFVLIELLQQTDEGIEYLLKHGKAKLAAELAEARKINPARIVRLWLLAGEPERAFRYARWSKAYAAALQILADRPELAKLLRLEWAQELAKAQHFSDAVSTIWPLVAERELARPWIAAAKTTDSLHLARMLACELQLDPERLTELNTELQGLLNQAGESAAHQREDFARALLRERKNIATERVAAPLLRALLLDYSTDRLSPNGGLLKQLEKWMDNPFWNADHPQLEMASPRKTQHMCEAPLLINVHGLGPSTICCAILIGPNRYLLGLGDAGAVLVDQSGRRLHYFKSAVHHLIQDTQGGTRVIALARRTALRVDLAILDLHHKTEQRWCSTRMHCFADSFDGSQWAVGIDNAMLLIAVPQFAKGTGSVLVNAPAAAFEANWHVGDLPAPVQRVHCFEKALWLQTQDQDGPYIFVYRWPELSLARRYSLPTDGVQNLFFDSDGPYCISDKALGEFVEEPGSPPKVPEPPVFYLRYFDQRTAWQLHPRLPRQYSSELYSSEHAGIGFAIQTGPTWIALSARKQACGESLVTVYSLLSRNPILHIDVSHAPEAQNPFVIQGNDQHLFCLTDQHIVHVDLELARVARFSL